MEKAEIIAKLETLLAMEQNDQVDTEWSGLRDAYQELREAGKQEQLQKFLEDGGEAKEFVEQPDAEDDRYKELQTAYRELKKKLEKERIAQQVANLDAKREIITALQQLIQEEENIGRAFQVFRELQDKWKTIGAVSDRHYKDVQTDYSRAVEAFYYNINIYKELQEHDLKRNLELKEELVGKMDALKEETSVKQLEAMVKALQTEWDEVGPTFKEEWEKVRDRFREATSVVYAKVRDHYQGLKANQQDNLKAKIALCEKVEALATEQPGSRKEWQQLTDQVLADQQAWKAIGFAGRKDHEKVWERFRAACDAFFARKKAYFDDLKGVYNINKKKKQALIEKADEIKERTDWKTATELFVRLQQEWKVAGPVMPREEQKLWKKFREACDHFFAAKKAHYDGMGDRQAENKEKKKALLDKVQAFSPGDDREAALHTVRELMREWNAIGPVSRQDREVLDKAFNQAVDGHFQALKVEDGAQKRMRFEARIDRLQQSEQSDRLLHREKNDIADQIRKLEAIVLQYENNLGFFAHVGDDHPMKKEVLDKIERTRQQVQALKEKRKLVERSLRKQA